MVSATPVKRFTVMDIILDLTVRERLVLAKDEMNGLHVQTLQRQYLMTGGGLSHCGRLLAELPEVREFPAWIRSFARRGGRISSRLAVRSTAAETKAG